MANGLTITKVTVFPFIDTANTGRFRGMARIELNSCIVIDAILASAKSLDLVIIKKTIEAPAPVTVGKKKQKVTTVCYGKRDTWNSVKDALDYFNEAANCADGCERERYLTIVSKLLGGETEDVSDEW